MIINTKRSMENARELKMDNGLNHLAYLHCLDLDRYYDKYCSVVSWSKNSGYSYGCISTGSSSLDVMYNKPKEVLGYSGVGHELVIYTDVELDHEKAYTLLRQNRFYASLLTNKNYKRIGIYMYKNILSIWLM